MGNRFRPRLVAAGAACLMALSITPGAASAATTSDPELKVMSWNVQGGNCSSHVDPQVMANRIDAISQAHAVTVFGLQEIHIDQVQRVRDQLATTSGVPYYYKFGPTSCGDTRGNAIISRYTITDSVFQPYAALNQAWDDNGEKRAAVGVKIAREGRRVWIFTTHLTVKGGADTGPAPVRARQAIELRNLADRYSTAPVRTIVTGDFNDRPSGDQVGVDDAYFEMHQHYSDTWGAWANRTGTPDKAGYTAPTSSPDRRIDYIWMNYNSMLGVTSSGVLQSTFSSDHFPLITRFAVWCDGCA